MASLGKLGQLSDAEYADLNERVDRFHAAWKSDGSMGPEGFLPAPGTRHRLFVLVELIKTDMERRAQAGLSIRVETYLGRFQDDLPGDKVPVSLLVEEYRLRHRHADKPSLEEYRHRFRTAFEELARQLGQSPDPGPAGPPRRDASIGFESQVDHTPSSGPANATRISTDVPGPTPIMPPAPAVPSHLADILPSDVKYKLIRRLGKGAFGEVYEAIAPGGFRVAIKRILRSVDHPASQGELESLEAIKALAHPFLIQMHAYWVFEDRLVIVMDLAEGSLADRMEYHKKQGLTGVPPEELIPFFEQAARALDYLHSKNVSHRDVKPENLLILQGYAKVADFGLARGHSHTLTNVPQEVGTPMYMAPEVWDEKVSFHSDQYSLAATYVAARLGRPLYPTKKLHELADRHVRGSPDLSPLPSAEQEVLLRALAKKPDERYPSCQAFTAELRKAVLAPPPPPPGAVVGRWNAFGVVLAATVAATLTCGLVIGLLYVLFRPAPVVPTTGPDNAVPPPITPERVPWCPPEWQADVAAGTRVVGDKKWHRKLTREVDGEKLVAMLVPHTNPDDPATFYLLENKITNRVFQAQWEQVEGDPVFQRFRDATQGTNPPPLPGEWKKGALELKSGKRLGIDGPLTELPVVAVTMPEAWFVARKLGGLLPTHDQWLKAVGAMGDGKKPGPAGPDAIGLTALQLKLRGLALGLDRPWPVTRKTPDVSVFGIHELVSNGQEWTGVTAEGVRLNFVQPPQGSALVLLVGQPWESVTVITIDAISNLRREASWTDWEVYAGFRIVLEVP